MRHFQIITAHIFTPRGVPPIKSKRACVLGCVSSYGNVWEPISISCIVWRRKADADKPKRWAVPEKMRSCGAIEMHEPELLLGQ